MKYFFKYLIIVLLPGITNAQVPDSTAKADSILLLQIEQQMQSSTNAPQQTRSSLNFNPDIGVVGDFGASWINRGNRNLEAYLKETELSLQATVDPYARADFFIAFGRDETGKYSVEVEEGYLTTLSLPAKLQLKVGKFKGAVGRINPIHGHALPFIDMPNAYVNYFGEEGLSDEGVSLSWLVPNKKFYQELIVQATAGNSETPSFFRGDNNRFTYLGHLKNFFTLNENSTLELGLTAICGPNDMSRTTHILAADLTYKWKPVKLNTYQSLTWQSEFFCGSRQNSPVETIHSFGLYTFLQYQIAKRWFLTGRYDYSQNQFDKSIKEQAYSLTAGWYATEFSKLELEAKTTDDNIDKRYYQAWLRWIFVIGAHGAHQY